MIETHLPKTTDMLHTLNLEQLNELKGQIDQMIQLKQPSLRVGMKCTVDSPRVAGMIGEIIKVNQVKCKVKFDGSTFNVEDKAETFNTTTHQIEEVLNFVNEWEDSGCDVFV